MTVCLNLQCPKSLNPDSARFCLWCGSPLRLGDRYRATDPLSRGGRTDTFAAIDEQTRSRCVIKRFRSQKSTTRGDRTANSTSTTTFRQAIDRLHQLGRHPQLPQLLDSIDLDGESYLVQEFIDGQSLESQLAGDGNFSERQVQQVLVEVLPVLHRFRVVASGSQDGTIRLWDLETGECQQTLLGGDGAIYAIAIAPDGETLISGSWDRTIALWNLPTGQRGSTECEHTLLVGAIAIHPINALAFRPDGQSLASGSQDGTIRLWRSH